MARNREPARLRKWRGRWVIVWCDPSTGNERRQDCEANGASNREQRIEMLEGIRGTQLHDSAEVRRLGGRLAYDRPLKAELAAFRKRVAERQAAREVNPEARSGLSPTSASYLERVTLHFESWLAVVGKERVTTGALDRSLIERYLSAVASEPIRDGRRATRRKAVSVNFFSRNLRTALRWIDGLRPRRFPDFAALAPAFKMLGTEATNPAAFAPIELQTFFARALERDDPARTVMVERRKGPGGRVERFEQTAAGSPETPISRTFLLLALLGCRLGEALALRWSDCDLDRGRITIRATKTGRTRIVPLIGAPEAVIAPRFVELLRVWRMQAGACEFVLPHGKMAAPRHPKHPWTSVARACKLQLLVPQRLRQNFASYAASLGVPPAVAALWQGHDAVIAERWYRAQVLDRMQGDSFEEAMGLNECIATLLGESLKPGNRRPRWVAP